MAPLVAVYRAELAVLVGPLVPDRHAALLQPAHVGVAAQEPEQLVEDRLEVQLLGGEQREAFAEREAQLPAEERERAGAGAIALARAALQHFAEQVEVLPLAARRSVRVTLDGGAHADTASQTSAALWKRSSGALASRRSRKAWCTASVSGRRGAGSWMWRRTSSAGLAESKIFLPLSIS